MFRGTLIRSGGNAKTIKGDKASAYETAIMYLAPADAVEGINLCPMAEMARCKAGCLFTAGRAATFSSINRARSAKTVRYRDNRAAFMAELAKDLERFVAYCLKRGVLPAVRLNGTSDIQWEVGHPVTRLAEWHGTDAAGELAVVGGGRAYASVFEAFPEVQFYDYTKVYKRAYRTLPANYRLTLSYSMASPIYADKVLQAARASGLNVAIVFREKETVAGLAGRPLHVSAGWEYASAINREVVDGDKTDLRFLDPQGVIVGLYAKGAAKRDTTGFVLP